MARGASSRRGTAQNPYRGVGGDAFLITCSLNAPDHRTTLPFRTRGAAKMAERATFGAINGSFQRDRRQSDPSLPTSGTPDRVRFLLAQRITARARVASRADKDKTAPARTERGA